MNRQDRAGIVAATLTSTIGEILEEEQLDVGEALAVMQMVSRSLQTAVDIQSLLAIRKFEGVPYSLKKSDANGE